MIIYTVLTQIFGLVFTFALSYYQKSIFFIPGGHFNWKKKTLLGSWQLQQCCLQSSMVAQENHYQSFGHLCSNSQLFVPSSDMQTFPLMVNPDRIFGMDFDYYI